MKDKCCKACYLVCLAVAVILGCFLVWGSQQDNFTYNARGYINQVVLCLVNNFAGNVEISGTLAMTVIPLDTTVPTFNITTPNMLPVCWDAYDYCCKKMVGQYLYVEIAPSNGSWIVIDASTKTSQYQDELIVFGSLGLIVAFGMLIGVVVWLVRFLQQNRYDSINTCQ